MAAVLMAITLSAEAAELPPELIDSSRVSTYAPADRILVSEALEQYDRATHDTVRYNAVFRIVQNLQHRDWVQWNTWMMEAILVELERSDLDEAIVDRYQRIYRSTLGNEGLVHSNRGELDEALEIMEQALKLHEEAHDLPGQASSLNNIGQVYSRKGDVNKALGYYQRSLEIRDKLGDKAGIALALNNLGFLYQRLGDVVKCIENYERALRFREETGDVHGIANSFHNLGAVHLEQGDTTTAMNYYRKAMHLRDSIGDQRGMAMTLNNLGFIYGSSGQHQLGIETYRKALAIYAEMEDPTGQATALQNIGAFFLGQHELDSCREYLDRAWVLNEKVGDLYARASILQVMAKLELASGNTDRAIDLGEQAINIAADHDYVKIIRDAAEVLSKASGVKGNWEDQYRYYALHIQWRDSIQNDETERAAVTQGLRYEYEKARIESEKEQEKRDALAQKEIEKQRYLSWGVGTICIMLLLLALVIWNRLKVTRKQKTVISGQKRLVEEKNQEIMDSINYAQRIQQSLLHTDESEAIGKLPHFVLFMPRDIVSGDFYWSYRKEQFVYVAVADCTGHGIPGAFLSMLGISFLNEISTTPGTLKPSEILDRLRDRVINELGQTYDGQGSRDGMDISLLRYDLDTHQVEWSGANNPLWIVRRQGKSVLSLDDLIELKPDRQPIGIHTSLQPFTNHEVSLQSGDCMYLFSDGFPDQFGGPKGKKFMYKPFRKFLLSIQDQSIEQHGLLLKEQFELWRGEIRQIDDVCIIGLACN